MLGRRSFKRQLRPRSTEKGSSSEGHGTGPSGSASSLPQKRLPAMKTGSKGKSSKGESSRGVRVASKEKNTQEEDVISPNNQEGTNLSVSRFPERQPSSFPEREPSHNETNDSSSHDSDLPDEGERSEGASRAPSRVGNAGNASSKKRVSGNTAVAVTFKKRRNENASFNGGPRAIPSSSRLLIQLNELKNKNEEQGKLIVSLRQDKENLLSQLNALKQSQLTPEKSSTETCEGPAKHALILKLEESMLKNKELEETLSSYRKSFVDIVKSNQGSNKKDKNIFMLDQYMPVWGLLKTKVKAWATKETMELNPEIAGNVRNWERRKIAVPELPEGFSVIGRNPMEIALDGQVYTPYYNNAAECLRHLFQFTIELCNEGSLKKMFDEVTKEECMNFFVRNKNVVGRIRQALSDTIGARKRAARDTFIQMLGFHNLLSRKGKLQGPSEEQAEKDREDFKTKVRVVMEDGTIDYSNWRMADVFKMKRSDFEANKTPNDSVMNSFSEDHLFKDEQRVFIYHQFLGYSPYKEFGEALDGSIISLARLDAWIATNAELMTAPVIKGGSRQRLFSSTFAKHLPLATAQLLQSIGSLVPRKEIDNCVVEVCDEANQKRYGVLKPDWFSKNISPRLGNVMDCYLSSMTMVEGKKIAQASDFCFLDDKDESYSPTEEEIMACAIEQPVNEEEGETESLQPNELILLQDDMMHDRDELLEIMKRTKSPVPSGQGNDDDSDSSSGSE